MGSQQAFRDLVREDLLLWFCRHHGYRTDGFHSDIVQRTSAHDARWFLNALTMSPSSLSAWEEPVIAIDAASRLHTTFGWPKPLVGLQAETLSRFDIVAYDATGAPRIVAVAKKTTRDVDGWIEAASRYLSCPPLEQLPASGEPRGVYNKVVALRRMRAPLLWVVGPRDYERLFRVEHAGDRGTARLNSAEMDELRYDCAFKGPAML